jgi:hypothetical protein
LLFSLADFNILKVAAGSILVDMHAPEKAAQEIQRQSVDANSRLRSGKVTRFTESIILENPRVLQVFTAQFTCFTGTEVQILTQQRYAARKCDTCPQRTPAYTAIYVEPHACGIPLESVQRAAHAVCPQSAGAAKQKESLSLN